MTEKNVCVRKSKDEVYIEYQLIILSDGHFVQTRWLLLRRLTNYPMCIYIKIR
jgi:hypothetical protein